MKPGPRATSTIKGSKKGVAQGLLRGLSLFEGSVPSEQIKVCNWVPTSDCIKVEPLQDSASWQKTLDLVDLLKSRKFALRKVTQYAPISNHFIKGLGNQPVTGIGTVKLISNVDGKACTITLKDVLFVPKAPHNLISLGRVMSAKIQVLFTDKDVRFRAPNQTIMAKGTKISNLYLMDVKVSAKQDHTYSIKVSTHTWDEWHRIMGHLNMASIKQLKSKGMVTGMEVDESVPATEQCPACILAKQHLTPYTQKI